MALFHTSQVKPPPPPPPPPPSATVQPNIWIPADPGTVKLNVDVALPEGFEFVRVGMVARNARGVTIWWARKELAGRPQLSDGDIVWDPNSYSARME